jgi:hypothetical protein
MEYLKTAAAHGAASLLLRHSHSITEAPKQLALVVSLPFEMCPFPIDNVRIAFVLLGQMLPIRERLGDQSSGVSFRSRTPLQFPSPISSRKIAICYTLVCRNISKEN